MRLSEVKICISDKLYVSGLPLTLEHDVIQDMTLVNPEYEQRQRMRLWLRDTPKTLTLAEHRGDKLVLPRGYLGALRQRIREAGGKFILDDKRLMLPSIDLEFKGKLRPYQAQAMENLTKHPDGVLVGGCGSGKTVIGCALIAHWRQPALVICHTKELLKQWCGELQNFLGVNAGQIGDGSFDIQPITVSLVQSLVSRPELLEDIKNRFGLILLDEAHHCPAKTFTEVIQYFPALFRYGLSATPERRDGLTDFLFSVIGHSRHTITSNELHAGGVLVTPEIRMIPTEFESFYEDDWVSLMTELTESDERNKFAVDVIVDLVDNGRKVIALSERVAHVEKLDSMINKLRKGASIPAYGKLPKRARETAFDKIRNGDAQVLLATKLADEGLNLPNLDAVVLLTPSRDAGRTMQRVGRTLRAVPNKPAPIVIDIVDVQVPLLASQARTRFFNCYRKISPKSRLPDWLNNKSMTA